MSVRAIPALASKIEVRTSPRKSAENDCIFSVTEYTLEFAFAGFLHGSADLVVLSGLGEVHREVNDRYVEGRNAEAHTRELTIELGDNLTYSLSSTRRRGDDVAGSSATTTPVLERGTVYRLLRSRRSVNRGHQTVGDTEVVVEDLRQRCETVRRARSVRYELRALDVLVGVDTADEHRRVVLRRSRHDDVLCTSVDVTLSLVLERKRPVDSTTYSAPISFHLRSAGLRSAVTRIF